MSIPMNIPNRRPSETFDLSSDGMSLTVSYDPASGFPCEIWFTSRGKIGTDIEERLAAAGIAASKAIQRKLPAE